MRWYCPNLSSHASPHIVKETRFLCTDLGTQLKPVIQAWAASSDEDRKCAECGKVVGVRELIGAVEA